MFLHPQLSDPNRVNLKFIYLTALIPFNDLKVGFHDFIVVRIIMVQHQRLDPPLGKDQAFCHRFVSL